MDIYEKEESPVAAPLTLEQISTDSDTFIEASRKMEDMRSTAFSFLLIGAAGLVFLILFYLKIIPFHMETYMRNMMTVIMGIMFIAFLIVGVHSFRQIKVLRSQSNDEVTREDQIRSHFFAEVTPSFVEEHLLFASEEIPEQRYYLRMEVMKQILQNQEPLLKDNYLDYLTEAFYNELFSEE